MENTSWNRKENTSYNTENKISFSGTSGSVTRNPYKILNPKRKDHNPNKMDHKKNCSNQLLKKENEII